MVAAPFGPIKGRPSGLPFIDWNLQFSNKFRFCVLQEEAHILKCPIKLSVLDSEGDGGYYLKEFYPWHCENPFLVL